MMIKIHLEKQNLIFLHFFSYLLLIFVSTINAECNVCQQNKVACINTTSFYLCLDETTPNTEVLYHCKAGFDCTDLNAICIQSSYTRAPSCGDTALCGLCRAHRNYIFACLSRTTFRLCYGAIHPTGQIGYCPTDYICDANSDNICVKPTANQKYTCDIISDDNASKSTTETTTSTSTEDPASMTPDELCAQINRVGVFPIMPADPYCKRYVRCRDVSSVLEGTEYNCTSNSYFRIDYALCVTNKPVYCI